MSMLGKLPGFGKGKKKKTFDFDLDSLLGDDPPPSNQPQPRISSQESLGRQKSEGSDFSPEQGDVGVKEEMTAEDVLSIAETLNVDDMDANLFGSFNQIKKPKKNGTKKDISGISSTSKDILKEKDKEVATKNSQKESIDNAQSNIISSNGPPVREKIDEELDDLMDLLSLDDPKETSVTKKKILKRTSQNASTESKPITCTPNEEGKKNEPTESNTSQTNIDEAKNPVTITSGSTASAAQTARQPAGSQTARQPAARGIDFYDDDDDDILSGMGFDDDDDKKSSPKVPPASSKVSLVQSGSGNLPEYVDSISKTSPSSAAKNNVNDEEEGFKFGGYTPSMADPASRSKSGRRRGTQFSSISSGSVVSSASKKSVRFSEELENTNLPSGLVGLKEVSETEAIEEQKSTKPQLRHVESRAGSIAPTGTRGSHEVLEQRQLSSTSIKSVFSFDDEKSESKEPKFEHPTFPWQKNKRNSSGVTSNKLVDLTYRETPTSQRSNQAHTLADGGRSESAEELKAAALKRIQDLEMTLEREKAEHAQTKKLLEDGSEQMREKYEGKLRQYQSRITELEINQQKADSNYKEKLEECKGNLHRVELERNQVQQLLETSKIHHEEELAAMEKSHKVRTSSMEESLTRRESRWKDELESEILRYQEKCQQVERDKQDAVLSLKQRLETLESLKKNEISRLRDSHRMAMEDMKREHEADRQHLIRMHSEEMDALKAAHSHTRMLSELNSKVDTSAKGVSELQQKLEKSHVKLMDEKEKRNKTQEEHLKVLEKRLLDQQAENESERTRLQSLIVKLETHISDQNRTVEQERWELQQNTTRFKTQEAAFQKERLSSQSKLEEDKAQFQSAKEQFLVEQQEILSKCYEEQRAVASERAEVLTLKKAAEEREMADKKKALQIQEDQRNYLAQISEETSRISTERMKLGKMQEELKCERRLLDTDRDTLETLAKEVQIRAEKMDELCKFSIELRDKGEHEMFEAQKLKEDCTNQSQSLQYQFSKLKELEQKLANEQLSLAEQKIEFENEMLISKMNKSVEERSLRLHRDAMKHRSSSPLPNTFENQQFRPRSSPIQNFNNKSLGAPPLPEREGVVDKGYSPRTSPAFSVEPETIESYLTGIETSIGLRQMIADAEEDYEELEKEKIFLASINSRTDSVFH